MCTHAEPPHCSGEAVFNEAPTKWLLYLVESACPPVGSILLTALTGNGGKKRCDGQVFTHQKDLCGRCQTPGLTQGLCLCAKSSTFSVSFRYSKRHSIDLHVMALQESVYGRAPVKWPECNDMELVALTIPRTAQRCRATISSTVLFTIFSEPPTQFQNTGQDGRAQV